jgi:hypothetical protein
LNSRREVVLKKIGSILTIVLCASPVKSFAASGPHSPLAFINFTAPAIRGYIADPTGNRTGVDPAVPLDAIGEQQLNGQDHALKEIPNSSVNQNNLDGQSTTGWEIDLREPSGTFLFNYSSDLPIGTGFLSMDVVNYQTGSKSMNTLYLIAQAGTYKQVRMDISADGSVAIADVVKPGDLSKDTQAACATNEIGPGEACEALEALAKEAEAALAKGHDDQLEDVLHVYLSVLDRLHNWKKDDGRHDWDDLQDRKECAGLDHTKVFFANDPAYSALVAEAGALLGAAPARARP